jgi:hypothetical protein
MHWAMMLMAQGSNFSDLDFCTMAMMIDTRGLCAA